MQLIANFEPASILGIACFGVDNALGGYGRLERSLRATCGR